MDRKFTLRVVRQQGAGHSHDMVATFYINTAFLVLAKIATEMGETENLSVKFFKPVTLKEMLEFRTRADYYMAY